MIAKEEKIVVARCEDFFQICEVLEGFSRFEIDYDKISEDAYQESIIVQAHARDDIQIVDCYDHLISLDFSVLEVLILMI